MWKARARAHVWTLACLVGCATACTPGERAAPSTEVATGSASGVQDTGTLPETSFPTADTALDTGSSTPSLPTQEGFDTGDVAPVSLLMNPSFEEGPATVPWDFSAPPAHWLRFGGGDYGWWEGEAADGDRYVELGGSPFALLYQRMPAEPGQRFLARAEATSAGGRGAGTLKLEFQDGDEVKLDSFEWALSAPRDWRDYTVGAVAPDDAAYATLALVGAGEAVFWDAAAVWVEETPRVTFDREATRQTFHGLGTQVWAYGWDDALLRRVLEELQIRYVRIENVYETATDEQLLTLHDMTSSLGIEWVFHCWSGPGTYSVAGPSSPAGVLVDVEGFAGWWVDQVVELDALGVRPPWIELMNEPDSGGAWSTGISSMDYADLVQQVRAGLDAQGLNEVKIVGPGGYAFNADHSSRDYLLEMSAGATSAVGAWSAHAWDDGVFCEGGAECLTQVARDFTDAIPVDTQDDRPFFVTEYATKETAFDGQVWPSPETTVGVNATDSVGYGLRMLENTLALLNAGSHAPFLWYLLDEPSLTTKMWGIVGIEGREKPAYTALKGLGFPQGSAVLEPPLFEGTGMYGGAVTSEDQTVVSLTHEGSVEQVFTLRIRHLPAAPEVEVQRFQAVSVGDAASGVPGVAEWVPVDPVTRYAEGTLDVDLTLPPGTALTVTARH